MLDFLSKLTCTYSVKIKRKIKHKTSPTGVTSEIMFGLERTFNFMQKNAKQVVSSG